MTGSAATLLSAPACSGRRSREEPAACQEIGRDVLDGPVLDVDASVQGGHCVGVELTGQPLQDRLDLRVARERRLAPDRREDAAREKAAIVLVG